RSHSPIASKGSTPQAEAAAVNERQLDVLLHDAREAYAALASQALQQVSAANLLLPPAEIATPFRGAEAVNGLPDSLPRPFAPLGHELRQVWDSLIDQVFTSQDSST
ncbi:MAG TPA: hypothetical protein VK137_17345, partial [Planctomycetaceae bacterium]|nr:hypothetical protein [Planctomycetaceae bacterium]